MTLEKHFIIVAHVPTKSITQGFIPELRQRALPLLIVTDQPERHQYLIDQGILQSNELLAIDVFNPIAVLNTLNQHQITPAAVFSNSDHLQTSTAMVAEYYQLPRKDWQACFKAKNKLAMRRALKSAALDTLWFKPILEVDDLADPSIRFPCIAKPVEGVASEHVSLLSSTEELQQYSAQFWQQNPTQTFLLEEFISGPLFTLETLGDGQDIQILGSFETFLSKPPSFIELGQTFNRTLPTDAVKPLLEQLKAIGVGFGSCHTEFIMTDHGPRLIEINYRNIGDQSDFLLSQALQFNLFAAVIDLYLGLPMPLAPSESDSAQIYCQIADRSGRIEYVPESREIEREGCTVHYEPLCKAGQQHQQDHSNRDYLSIFRGTGPSQRILSAVMNDLMEELAIQFAADETMQEA
ncbi:ATP-grasp domain-containing protein [Marinomonas agarivorans]|nr:ATP-grasp domain-containing protein [Marinomonas agarivorans]